MNEQCFDKAYEILIKIEFNSPSNALHHNKGEDGYTFMGIYEKAHPEWSGWKKVKQIAKFYDNLKVASQRAYSSLLLREKAKEFYKEHFWDKMKLEKIEDCHKAEEMFIFGVNAGTTNAVKIAQELVGVETDGKIGPITIGAINRFNEKLFDRFYDLYEKDYYKDLALNHDRLKRYLNGWLNRSEVV